MAVPKKRTSHSRTRKRNSHSALKRVNVVVDKNGDYTMQHNISPNGYYKGVQVIKSKEAKTA